VYCKRRDKLMSKTPSLSLRLRISEPLRQGALFHICSAYVPSLFRRHLMPHQCIEVVMDHKLQNILDGLPEMAPRSYLDPYREFVGELRRRGRTYREIARILADECQIRPSVSTVYRCLHSRIRTNPQSRNRQSPRLPEMTRQSPLPLTEDKSGSKKAPPESDEIRKRIAALKQRPMTIQQEPKRFHFDPNEPLHIPQQAGDKTEL